MSIPPPSPKRDVSRADPFPPLEESKGKQAKTSQQSLIAEIFSNLSHLKERTWMLARQTGTVIDRQWVNLTHQVSSILESLKKIFLSFRENSHLSETTVVPIKVVPQAAVDLQEEVNVQKEEGDLQKEEASLQSKKIEEAEKKWQKAQKSLLHVHVVHLNNLNGLLSNHLLHAQNLLQDHFLSLKASSLEEKGRDLLNNLEDYRVQLEANLKKYTDSFSPDSSIDSLEAMGINTLKDVEDKAKEVVSKANAINQQMKAIKEALPEGNLKGFITARQNAMMANIKTWISERNSKTQGHLKDMLKAKEEWTALKKTLPDDSKTNEEGAEKS